MKLSNKEILSSQLLPKELSDSKVCPWIPILVILVLSTALRLYQIGTESLWIDENFSIRDAEQLRLGTRPLYYVLLRLWMVFGTSDTWLRLLSVPFSLGSVYLTYLLGLKVASRSVGLMAAFVMAVSPLFVGYAQEIRMYSLSTFLTLWGTLALIDILENTTKYSFRSWILARGLALLTTPLNILLLLADLILLGWKFREQRHRFRKLGKGLILIGLFWLPFAYVLWKATPRFMTGWVVYQAKPGLGAIPSSLVEFTAFWPLTNLYKLRELDFSLASWTRNETRLLFYGIYALIMVFLLGISLLTVKDQIQEKTNPPKLLWVVIWALFPSLLLVIISHVLSSIWRDRYLIFVAPYYLILLAVGFQQLWRHYRAIAFGIGLVYFIAVAGGLNHYYKVIYHDDWKGVAQLIQQQEKPGDVIGFFADEWEPHLALPRYYKGSSSLHIMASGKIPPTREEGPSFLPKMFDNLPPTQSRYWIVYYEPHGLDRETVTNTIKKRYNVIYSQRFGNSVNFDTIVFLVKPR